MAPPSEKPDDKVDKINKYSAAPDENVNDWYFQVRGTLYGMGILDVFDKKMKDPRYTIPAEISTPIGKFKKKEVEAKLAKFYTSLTGALGGAALTSARGITEKCGVKVVKKLLADENSQSSGRRLGVLRSLITDGPEGDEDMKKFCQRKKDQARDQLDSKVTIEELIALGVLGNAGQSHSQITVPLLASDTTDIDKIQKLLTESETNAKLFVSENDKSLVLATNAPTAEEKRVKQEGNRDRKMDKLINAMANFVDKKKKGGGKGWYKPNYRKGGGKGYGKGYGKWGKNYVKKGDQKRKCWICGSEKHQKHECPKKGHGRDGK